MKLAVAPLSTNARSSTLPLKVYKSNGIVTELNLLIYIFRRRKTLTKAASFGPFKNPERGRRIFLFRPRSHFLAGRRSLLFPQRILWLLFWELGCLRHMPRLFRRLGRLWRFRGLAFFCRTTD